MKHPREILKSWVHKKLDFTKGAATFQKCVFTETVLGQWQLSFICKIYKVQGKFFFISQLQCPQLL